MTCLSILTFVALAVGQATAAPRALARNAPIDLRPSSGERPAATSGPSGLFPRKTIRCTLGPRSMQLVLAGVTKEPSEEERSIGSPYLFVESASSTRGKPAVPVASFAAGGPQTGLSFLKKSGSNHYCRDTMAFRAGRGLLGLAFQVDDRPNPEQLGVVFFDLKRNRIVDSADRLGAFAGLAIDGATLEYQSMMSRTESTGDVETTVKGGVVVLEEDELRPWYRVGLSAVTSRGASPASKLVRQADRERTWAQSPWRGFFKSRDDFEASFGYNFGTAAYERPWVYIAHLRDKPDERCLLASSERMPRFKPDSSWICSKKKLD